MIRPTLITLGCVLGLLASACGGETPTAYDGENRDAFIAACTDRGDDELIQQRVCLCVVEEAEATISFARFDEINAELAADPSAPLPAEILELLATCIVEEADL